MTVIEQQLTMDVGHRNLRQTLDDSLRLEFRERAVKLARATASKLKADLAIVDKRRPEATLPRL